MLRISVERADDVVVVKSVGRIVRGQESALREAVTAQKSARVVVLDLSEVESLDAGGLNLLVSLHHWAEKNGMQLKLVNPRPFVYEMLTRTHLDCIFDISCLNDALLVLGGCESVRAHATA
jgi:anti-anti-sigma factor